MLSSAAIEAPSPPAPGSRRRMDGELHEVGAQEDGYPPPLSMLLCASVRSGFKQSCNGTWPFYKADETRRSYICCPGTACVCVCVRAMCKCQVVSHQPNLSSLHQLTKIKHCKSQTSTCLGYSLLTRKITEMFYSYSYSPNPIHLPPPPFIGPQRPRGRPNAGARPAIANVLVRLVLNPPPIEPSDPPTPSCSTGAGRLLALSWCMGGRS